MRTGQKDPAPPAVRERIVDTASRLFYREGIQAVGIQRLIDEAGIAKASLYAHFPSKADVVAEYLTRQSAAFRDRVGRLVLDSPVPPREKTLRLFDFLADWSASTEFRGCPFQNAGAEFPAAGHPVRAVIDRHRAWLREMLGGLVRALGVRETAHLAGALLVLADGAAATSALDSSQAARQARWAAEHLIDTAARRRRQVRPARSKRRPTGANRRPRA